MERISTYCVYLITTSLRYSRPVVVVLQFSDLHFKLSIRCIHIAYTLGTLAVAHSEELQCYSCYSAFCYAGKALCVFEIKRAVLRAGRGIVFLRYGSASGGTSVDQLRFFLLPGCSVC